MKAINVQILCHDENLDSIIEDLYKLATDPRTAGIEVVAYQAEANPTVYDPERPESDENWDLRILH